MGINQKIAERMTRHVIAIDRHVSASSRKIAELLDALAEDLIERVKQFKRDAKSPPTMAQRRTIALLDQIRDAFGQTYLDVAIGFDHDLEREARREVAFINDVLNDALGIDISTVQFDTKVLKAIVEHETVEGAPASKWWKKQAQRHFTRFKQKIRQDFAAGRTTDETIVWMRGTKANRFRDGFMTLSKAQAAALARTAFNSVANNARIQTLKENADIMRGYVQISHLDERTTQICTDYAGAQWDLSFRPIGDKKLPYAGGCPRHFNCRSVISPLLKSWNELQGSNSIARKRGVDLDAAATGSRFESLYRQRLAAKGFDASAIDGILEQRRAELGDTIVTTTSFTTRDLLASRTKKTNR